MADNNEALIAGTRAYWDRWKRWLDANPGTDSKLVDRLVARGDPPPDKTDTAVFIDDWKSATAVRQAFRSLRIAKGDYREIDKMVGTIVAIVDAELSGESMAAVFDRPDTCHITTYHKKWKLDPDFTACLTAVREVAHGWEDGARGMALAQAARLLAVASPKAAQKAVAQIDSHDPNVSLRAAFGILDRAGVETAVKSSQTIDGELGVTVEDAKQSVMGKLAKMRRTLEEGGKQGTDNPE